MLNYNRGIFVITGNGEFGFEENVFLFDHIKVKALLNKVFYNPSILKTSPSRVQTDQCSAVLAISEITTQKNTTQCGLLLFLQ